MAYIITKQNWDRICWFYMSQGKACQFNEYCKSVFKKIIEIKNVRPADKSTIDKLFLFENIRLTSSKYVEVCTYVINSYCNSRFLISHMSKIRNTRISSLYLA